MSDVNDSDAVEVQGFSNCCNGKVGAEVFKAAAENQILRDMVFPHGVTLMSPGDTAELNNSSNCCNGKVGGDPKI
ncbi:MULTISPECIES: hypothetical protein [Klebsiella/Raoultella group]|uniref:hypothetical protein n=1 Tax=Klebsiella/Raoultella group TaxID=2890311 RepID=UPI001BCC1A52|nr:hypothetical protein [Klebsiella grimontii]